MTEWVIYIPIPSRRNFELALVRKVWGAKKDVLSRVHAGDRIVFIQEVTGSLRVKQLEGRTAKRVVFARAVGNAFQSEEEVWPDDVYPFRLQFEVDDDRPSLQAVALPGEILTSSHAEAARQSANTMSSPRMVDPEIAAVQGQEALGDNEASPTTWGVLINGAYQELLDDIAGEHQEHPERSLYLQPNGSTVIARLRDHFSSSDARPVPLFVSTSDRLDAVDYSGHVTAWADKGELSGRDAARIDSVIREFQPSEPRGLFFDAAQPTGREPRNLIEVRRFRRVIRTPVTSLRKLDGSPCQVRPRSGGVTYVAADQELSAVYSGAREAVFREGERLKREATFIQRNRRLVEAARKYYEDRCEACGTRLSDVYGAIAEGMVEMHHREPISERESATQLSSTKDIAPLCPNCHRVIHRMKDELGRTESVQQLKLHLLAKRKGDGG